MADSDVHFRRIGETRRYAFAHGICLALPCWSPDLLRHEDGTTSWGCLRRHQVGCPPFGGATADPLIRIKRKREGWVRT